MDHTQVAEALAETCYRLGCRGITPLEWSPMHLLGELDETRMMEAYLKRGTNEWNDARDAKQEKVGQGTADPQAMGRGRTCYDGTENRDETYHLPQSTSGDGHCRMG
eukprot:4489275-Pleurochrysis_carterae.AAC.1